MLYNKIQIVALCKLIENFELLENLFIAKKFLIHRVCFLYKFKTLNNKSNNDCMMRFKELLIVFYKIWLYEQGET